MKLKDCFENMISGEWGEECLVGDKGTKILRTTNFTNIGKINYSDVVERKINDAKIDKKRLKYGDIILEKSGGTDKTPVGRVVFCDEDIKADTYLCNNFTVGLRTKKDYFAKYLFYLMFFYHLQGRTLSLQNKTTGIRNLKVDSYLNCEINIPSKPEQQRIADELDKVSGLIEKRQKQLEKLDLLIKSRFVEMFNKQYQYASLGSLSEVKSGGTPNRDKHEYWDYGNIPWIKTTELKNSIICGSEEHITEEGLKNSSAKIVPKNTILIAMYGQGKTRGMTGLLAMQAATNQACACVLPNKQINQKYLWEFLKLNYDKLRNMAKGGNQPNLNLQQIKDFQILWPPIELQNQFADFVEKVEQNKSKVKNSLDKLITLKKALMQKYFG